MADLVRLAFHVRLRVPVGNVVHRRGWLMRGPAGWGEYSPLPSWSDAEMAAAEGAAIEAATIGFPPSQRDRVEVNALVPRVAADEAARLALASGCRTIKIKVGDEDGFARVRAVREAMGAGAHIRLDANGAWTVDEAEEALRALAAFDIEFVEDPVASIGDCAMLRRRTSIPIAVESCVRTVADARALRGADAADVLVIKPQRIGGGVAALEAADAAGIPVVASSALETSVGLSLVLAVAAALPDPGLAHGVGTALLLEGDVVDEPLLPVAGWLSPRLVDVDRKLVHE